MSQVHPQARTSTEIRFSQDSSTELTKRHDATVATVRKWCGRDDMQDRSHCPDTPSATLVPAQEVLVVEMRGMLLLPLEDLLAITHEFINPKASRSGVNCCVVRPDVNEIAGLLPVVEGEAALKNTVKDYEPGFLHLDIRYLPQMRDETQRRDLLVAIDRATRWVHFRIIYPNQCEASSTDLLRCLRTAAPMVIGKVLTDNGSWFTDRFTSTGEQASAEHAFDAYLQRIRHRAQARPTAPSADQQYGRAVQRSHQRPRQANPLRQRSRAGDKAPAVSRSIATASRNAPCTTEPHPHAHKLEKKARVAP